MEGATTRTTPGKPRYWCGGARQMRGASMQGGYSKDALIKLVAPSRVLPQSGDTHPQNPKP